MGLTNWKNSPEGKIRKSDVSIAKNYLIEEELKPATGKRCRKNVVWNWRIFTTKCYAVWEAKKALWGKYL